MKAFNRNVAMGLIVMCTLATATSVTASYTGQPTVVINGATIATTVAPYIENGTTMVPLRSISEYMGANVDWNPETRAIHIEKGSRTVDLTVGQVAAKINGETVTASISPVIKNSYTMVPLRFIGEALDCQVAWDANTKTVIITSSDADLATPALPVASTDAYGRKIRTTNLPKNASQFPYIAEEIPNWCYEIQPTIMKNNYWGPAWYTDTKLKGDTAADVAKANSDLYPQNLSGGVYEMVDKFVNLQTNQDFNTMDADWVNGMLSCFSDTQMNALAAQWKNDPVKTVKEDLEGWMKTKKSEQMITSSKYKVMPEGMWVDVYGYPHVPVYVQYTINSCKDPKDIFNTTFGEANCSANPKTGYKVGTTYEAVVTYTLTKDSKEQWKIDYSSCDIDPQLRPETDATDGVNPSMKDTNRQNEFGYWWLKDTKSTFNRYAEASIDIQGKVY